MRVRPIDLVDVFVCLVVLGVFIQLFPAVISESFLVALLTAVLLKIVLEGVLFVKKRIVARIRAPRGPWMRALNIGMLLLVLPASKLLVLELLDLVFGDAVYLGGFFLVICATDDPFVNRLLESFVFKCLRILPTGKI